MTQQQQTIALQSTVRNLEQIRARRALNDAQLNLRKEYVKKLPAMILQNGLMGALAFAIDKGEEYGRIFACIINHLRSDELQLLQLPTGERRNNDELLQRMMQEMGDVSAAKLRLVTAETMAYLNYLRRFA